MIQVRRSILLNMSFDRMLLPLPSVLTETIALGSSLALLVLMLVDGVAPTVAVLWMPVAELQERYPAHAHAEGMEPAPR